MRLLPLALGMLMLVPELTSGNLPPSADLKWIPTNDRKPADFSVELRNLEGTKVSLEDFRNKVLLVNVWATWCGPCKEEMPSIAALYDNLHEKGFEVVAITNDNARKVRGFLKRKQFPFAILLDSKEKFIERFRVDRLPTTLVIDKSGRLALHHAGVADWNSPPIIEALQSLMSSSADQ